jgi:membrane-associated phospholipid phosphatase
MWVVRLWCFRGPAKPVDIREFFRFGYHQAVPRLLLFLLLLLAVATLVQLSASRRNRSNANSWLPKGWPDAVNQLALFALADLCYETVRGIAEGNSALAFANARWIVEAEQNMGLFIEQDFQAWVMGERILIDFANFMYVNSHFIITSCALVWIYLRHNRHFYFVRNMFMVAMALALVGYLSFPTAPPRFLPELGFVDTIAYYADVRHDSALVALFINPYAAVPSMHVAFSLMLAVPAMFLVRRPIAKVAWALYPPLVTAVVIVTGNHWWLDAAAGALVALAAALVAHYALSRVRPGDWAWNPRRAQATF